MSEARPTPPSIKASDWFVARTRSRHEKTVARYLQARDIEHRLPLYPSRSRVKQVTSELPLFPGYVFVNISRDRHLEVLKAPGVADFISFGSGPFSLTADDVEMLRRCAQLGPQAKPYIYVPGEKVLICCGPFEGIRGILIRSRCPSRVIVSVEFLQRSIELEIGSACLFGSNAVTGPEN